MAYFLTKKKADIQDKNLARIFKNRANTALAGGHLPLTEGLKRMLKTDNS